MHLVEGLAAGFVQDADQVDHAGRPGDGAAERRLAAQIGALHDDLADGAERLQMHATASRAAADDQDARAAIGQSLDHVAPDEAGAPEDREQTMAHRGSLSDDGVDNNARLRPKTSPAKSCNPAGDGG